MGLLPMPPNPGHIGKHCNIAKPSSAVAGDRQGKKGDPFIPQKGLQAGGADQGPPRLRLPRPGRRGVQ